MRCEVFLGRFDRLDRGEDMGRAMKRHLARCDSCKNVVDRVAFALEHLHGGSPGTIADEERLEERVMAAVRLMPRPSSEFFSTRDWIIAGAVIAASMLLIPLGKDFNRIKAIFGTSFALPLSLVLGVAVTAYAALFIGTHVDEVEDFVRRHARQQ